MLENINLKKSLSREEYKLALPGLQQRLYDLEKTCWDLGVPSVVVLHRLEFRLDGAAPCQANDVAAPHCVEIEMEATPTPEAINGIDAALVKQGKGHLHYWSSLKNRIIVDPNTLLSYQQDMRRAHYLQLDNSAVESEVTQSLDRVNYRPSGTRSLR